MFDPLQTFFELSRRGYNSVCGKRCIIFTLSKGSRELCPVGSNSRIQACLYENLYCHIWWNIDSKRFTVSVLLVKIYPLTAQLAMK